MAHLPSPSRDRVAAILLFCALCGVLLGLGARVLRQRAMGPAPPRQTPSVPDLGVPGIPDRRVAGSGLVDAGIRRVEGDAGASSAVGLSSSAGGRALGVLVLDVRGQPVVGATVTARLELSPRELLAAPQATLSARPPAKSATTPQPIGELGVLSGPLPFPEDIISGAFHGPGAVQRGSGAAAALTAVTDGKGEARLFPVPPGLLQLQVNKDGKSAAAEVVVSALPADASLESASASATPALRLVLRLGAQPEALCTLPGEPGDPAPAASDGPEVAGRVEDARGFAVSGARLELTSGRVRTQTITDPRGAFSARGLPAGALTVGVRHPGFAPLTLNHAADKPRHELRLTLHPGGGVDGLVRDGRAGGVPPGTQLFVEGEGGLREAIGLAADGRFVATGLLPGELTLRARAPGFAPLAMTIKVPAGETPAQVTVHDVRLDLLRGATLRGRLRGPEGSVAAVAVTLTPAGQERPLSQVVTDARGEFVATDLPPGKLRLKATAGTTSATAEVELHAGDTHHAELELR